MKTAYWHVYLTEERGVWAAIVMEQLACMEKVNLLNRLDAFKITCVARRETHEDCKHRYDFASLVYSIAGNKALIEFVDNPYESDFRMCEAIEEGSFVGVSENHTLRKIYKDCLDVDQTLLYFHTKGITSDLRHLDTGNYNAYRNYYFWRQFLNWGAIEMWPACVAHLEDGYDLAGPNFQQNPVPHYSGAFYWTKSSHIRQLPDPATTQWWEDLQARTTDPWLKSCSSRFKDELWIGQAPYNYTAINLGPGANPANTFVPQSEYWK